MADVVDIANEEAERALQRSLDSRTRFQGDSALECMDCDDPIPAARRRALPGVELCVFCQERKERQR